MDMSKDDETERVALSMSFEAVNDAISELQEEQQKQEATHWYSMTADNTASYIVYPPELQDSPPKMPGSGGDQYDSDRSVREVVKSAGVDYISVEERETILGDPSENRSSQHTPTQEADYSSLYGKSEDKMSTSSESSGRGSAEMEKVSPIRPSKGRSSRTSSDASTIRNDQSPLPSTTSILKDVPGYLSPSTRAQLMGDAPPTDSYTSSSQFKTLIAGTEDDTTLAEYSMPLSDRSSIYQSNSVSGSDVGSTTTYKSIGRDAFKHDLLVDGMDRLTPIIDVSGRSSQLVGQDNSPHCESMGRHDSSGVFPDRLSKIVHDICQPSPTADGDDAKSQTDSSPRLDPLTERSRVSSRTEYEGLPTSLHDSRLTPDYAAKIMSPGQDDLSSGGRSSGNTEYEGLPHSLHNSRLTPDFAEKITRGPDDRRHSDKFEHAKRTESIGRDSFNSADSQYDDIDIGALNKSSRGVLQEAAAEFHANHSENRLKLYAAGEEHHQSHDYSTPSEISSASEAELAKLMHTSGLSEKPTDLTSASVKLLLDNSTQRLFAEGNERKMSTDATSTTTRSMVSSSAPSQSHASNQSVKSLPSNASSQANAPPQSTASRLTRREFLASVPSRSLQDLDLSPSTLVSNRLDRIEFMVLSGLNDKKSSIPSIPSVPQSARPSTPDASEVTSYKDINGPLHYDRGCEPKPYTTSVSRKEDQTPRSEVTSYKDIGNKSAYDQRQADDSRHYQNGQAVLSNEYPPTINRDVDHKSAYDRRLADDDRHYRTRQSAPPSEYADATDKYGRHYTTAQECKENQPEEEFNPPKTTGQTNYSYRREPYRREALPYPPITLPDYSVQLSVPTIPRGTDESFNIGISPCKDLPFTAFDNAAKLLSEKLEQRAAEKTPGRSRPVDSGKFQLDLSHLEGRSRSRDRTPTSSRKKSDLENIPDSRPLQIEQAAPSPTDELVKRRPKYRSGDVSQDESVTTMESTHTDSDDAQPPELSQDVLGSRTDPTEPSPGIYGTRRPKSSASQHSSKTLTQDDVNTHLTQSATASPELSPRSHRSAAVAKAEELLAKGRCSRDNFVNNLYKNIQQYSPRSTDGGDVAELLNTPYRRPSSREQKTPVREDNSPSPDLYTRSEALADMTVIPMDFYSPVRTVNRRDQQETKEKESRPVRPLERVSPPPATTYRVRDDERWTGHVTSDVPSYRRAHPPITPLERGSETEVEPNYHRPSTPGTKEFLHSDDLNLPSRSYSPQSGRHGSDEHRSFKCEDVGSSYVPTRSYVDDSCSHNPGRSIYDTDRLSPPLERMSYEVAHNRDPEPLEATTTSNLKARMAGAKQDRQMTYHILREELLKAEDDAKNRELNMAWERITRRKPMDETSSSNATTASSEAFNESRMKKLRSLLVDPLNHLVQKSKPKTREKNGSQPESQLRNKSKLNSLYEKIQRQKSESSFDGSTINTTTIASSEDTVCTRCEEKRQLKKQNKENLKPSEKENHTLDKKCQVMMSESECSDTEPSRHKKDASVMCPSPAVLHDKTCSMNKRDKSPKRKKTHDKLEESLAWYVDAKKEKNIMDTAYEKAKQLDVKSAGLCWDIPMNNPRPWTKSLIEQQAHAKSQEPWLPGRTRYETASEHRRMNELRKEYQEITARTHYIPTLQEAFRDRLRHVVSGSRERQRVIKHRAEERKINQLHDERRMRLFDMQPSAQRKIIPTTTFGEDRTLPKRVMSKEEMRDRTERMYKDLPEVRQKKKVNLTQQEKESHRLKAKLFNKRVQRRVLENAKLAQVRKASAHYTKKKPAARHGYDF